MAKLGLGKGLTSFKDRIAKTQKQLDSLGVVEGSPQLIESANMIRANESLSRILAIQKQLLDDYAAYTAQLESTISLAFEIQHDLVSLVDDQYSLIDSK